MAGINGIQGLNFFENFKVGNARFNAATKPTDKQMYKEAAQAFNTGVYNLNHPRHDGLVSPLAKALDISG